MTITADDWKVLFLEAECERRQLLRCKAAAGIQVEALQATISELGHRITSQDAPAHCPGPGLPPSGGDTETMPDGSTQLVPSEVAALPGWATAIWRRAFPPLMTAPGSGPSAIPMGGGPQEPTARELISMFREIASARGAGNGPPRPGNLDADAEVDG